MASKPLRLGMYPPNASHVREKYEHCSRRLLHRGWLAPFSQWQRKIISGRLPQPQFVGGNLVQMNDKANPVKPFLRWAGGKRWIAQELARLIPPSIRTYYEPFLGSGSLYFAALPRKAVLSDMNCRLIEAYEIIRDRPKAVIAVLENWSNEENDYYLIREIDFPTKVHRVAQFIYLNRTCWNGLYRVNRQGKFNVPFANHGRAVFDAQHLLSVSNALTNVELKCGDFAEAVSHAERGDFVYFDPPYVAYRENRGFNKYNTEAFTWCDQQRLGSLAVDLANRGCYVVVSNIRQDDILQLYPGFHHREISRRSILAAKSKFRGATTELLLVSEPKLFKAFGR